MTGYVMGSELKAILFTYSEKVKNKEVKKIDYKIWQKLVNLSKKVIIQWESSESNSIVIDTFDEKVKIEDNYLFVQLFLPTTTSTGYSEMKPTATISTATSAAITATDSYCDNEITTGGSAYYNTNTLTVSSEGLLDTTIRGIDIKPYIYDNNEYIGIGKESENMNILKNFDFGMVKGDNVKLSMYGLCVKNKTGTYVAYNATDNALMDVDILNFDGQKFLLKMPVALDQVSEGDVIVHNNTPVFVIGVPKDRASLDVIDPVAGERKEILPLRSPFGFDFVTKVVNLFDQFTGSSKADAANPFGNMLPLMLLNDGMDKDDMLPMMLMMGGGNIDPMMAMLMTNGDNKDMLLPMMLMMRK